MLCIDGKENLIIFIEIVVVKYLNGIVIVFEVCIFFENYLLCGNCIIKINVENFNVFCLYNFFLLVIVGIYIKYEYDCIYKVDFNLLLKLYYFYDINVIILIFFLGI